jgi:hypothetical protein
MVPISSDSQDVTGQTVNYFFPVLKDAQKSSTKAETCAATFAKPNRQPIELHAFMP